MASISKQKGLAGRITACQRPFCFDIFAILTPRRDIQRVLTLINQPKL